MKFKFVFQFAKQSYGAPAAKTSYGGPVQQQSRTFFYGGPQQQHQLSCQQQGQVPSFEQLTKNRMLEEKRFYCIKSNAKWLTMGIVPASKMLSDDAPGFYFEAFLCGDGKPSMPLGGIDGVMSLFATIRQMPQFQQVPLPAKRRILQRNNITISTVDFNDDVSRSLCF